MSDTGSKHDERLLFQLLQPSYLSATFSMLLTVVIMGAAGISRLYSSQGWLAETLHTISESDHHLIQLRLANGGDKLSLVILFMFWACIGLVVYYFVIGLARGIDGISEVSQELGYVHTKRGSLLTQVLARTGVRLAGVFGLFFAATMLVKFAIPSGISAVQVVALSVSSVVSVVVAAAAILICSHLVVVMARLVVLRPRIFSSTI